MSFTDPRDGYQYSTVKIGEQTWLAENFRFGADTERVTPTGLKEHYYAWETAIRAVPDGWRMPTAADFSKLLKGVGGGYTEGARADSGRGGDSAYRHLVAGGSTGFGFQATGFIRDEEHMDHGGTMWTSSTPASTFQRAKVCVLFESKVGLDWRSKDFRHPLRLIQGKQGAFVKPVNKMIQKITPQLLRCTTRDDRQSLFSTLGKTYDKMRASEDIFIDERDLHVYSLVRMGGRVWLGENLSFQVPGARSAIGHGGLSPYPYGMHYSLQEARSALPEGFRLPTAKDWEPVIDSVPVISGAKRGVRMSATKGVSPLHLIETGSLEGDKRKNFGENGSWWCDDGKHYLYLSRVSMKELTLFKPYKGLRMPVRCLRDE